MLVAMVFWLEDDWIGGKDKKKFIPWLCVKDNTTLSL